MKRDKWADDPKDIRNFICDACLIKLEAAISGPDLCSYHSEFCDKCRRKLDELGLG